MKVNQSLDEVTVGTDSWNHWVASPGHRGLLYEQLQPRDQGMVSCGGGGGGMGHSEEGRRQDVGTMLVSRGPGGANRMDAHQQNVWSSVRTANCPQRQKAVLPKELDFWGPLAPTENRTETRALPFRWSSTKKTFSNSQKSALNQESVWRLEMCSGHVGHEVPRALARAVSASAAANGPFPG